MSRCFNGLHCLAIQWLEMVLILRIHLTNRIILIFTLGSTQHGLSFGLTFIWSWASPLMNTILFRKGWRIGTQFEMSLFGQQTGFLAVTWYEVLLVVLDVVLMTIRNILDRCYTISELLSLLFIKSIEFLIWISIHTVHFSSVVIIICGQILTCLRAELEIRLFIIHLVLLHFQSVSIVVTFEKLTIIGHVATRIYSISSGLDFGCFTYREIALPRILNHLFTLLGLSFCLPIFILLHFNRLFDQILTIWSLRHFVFSSKAKMSSLNLHFLLKSLSFWYIYALDLIHLEFLGRSLNIAKLVSLLGLWWWT